MKHQIIDPTQTAYWSIAIAELDPKNAKVVLHKKMLEKQQYPSPYECATLAGTLARLVGGSEINYLVDYFYTAVCGGEAEHFQQAFLAELPRLPSQTSKAILVRIVQDPRLEQVHQYAFSDLLKALSSYFDAKKLTFDTSRWYLADPIYAKQEPEASAQVKAQIKETCAELKKIVSQ